MPSSESTYGTLVITALIILIFVSIVFVLVTDMPVLDEKKEKNGIMVTLYQRQSLYRPGPTKMVVKLFVFKTFWTISVIKQVVIPLVECCRLVPSHYS